MISGILISLIAITGHPARLYKDAYLYSAPSSHARKLMLIRAPHDFVLTSLQPTHGFYKVNTYEQDGRWHVAFVQRGSLRVDKQDEVSLSAPENAASAVAARAMALVGEEWKGPSKTVPDRAASFLTFVFRNIDNLTPTLPEQMKEGKGAPLPPLRGDRVYFKLGMTKSAGVAVGGNVVIGIDSSGVVSILDLRDLSDPTIRR